MGEYSVEEMVSDLVTQVTRLRDRVNELDRQQLNIIHWVALALPGAASPPAVGVPVPGVTVGEGGAVVGTDAARPQAQVARPIPQGHPQAVASNTSTATPTARQRIFITEKCMLYEKIS